MTFRHATYATFFIGLGFAIGACDTCGGSGSGSARSNANEDAEGVAAPSASASAEMIFDAATPCSGSAIDLAAALGDPTCTVTSGIAKSTRAVFEIAADAGKQVLKQEAVRLDDGRVEVRVANHGAAPVAIPLSWHPKIPTFIVLADNPKEKALYELEAPTLAVDLDGGPVTATFARVTIMPGGYAFARVAIDPKIVKRAGKSSAGGDAGPLPAKIGDGKWVLHIGQLVSDVDTGEPAVLVWNIEAHD